MANNSADCLTEALALLELADKLVESRGVPWPIHYAEEGLSEPSTPLRVERVLESSANYVLVEVGESAGTLPEARRNQVLAIVQEALDYSKRLTATGNSSRQIWHEAHDKITMMALDELLKCACAKSN